MTQQELYDKIINDYQEMIVSQNFEKFPEVFKLVKQYDNLSDFGNYGPYLLERHLISLTDSLPKPLDNDYDEKMNILIHECKEVLATIDKEEKADSGWGWDNVFYFATNRLIQFYETDGDLKEALSYTEQLMNRQNEWDMRHSLGRSGVFKPEVVFAYTTYVRILLALGQKEKAYTFVSDIFDFYTDMKEFADFKQNADFLAWQSTYDKHLEKLAEQKACEPIRKRIQQLKAKLERLKALDKSKIVKGAKKHKYKLLPPLTIQQVESFEYKEKLKLPLEYKMFLTEFSSGGAGPFDGIMEVNWSSWGIDEIPFYFTHEHPCNRVKFENGEDNTPAKYFEYPYPLTGDKYITWENRTTLNALILRGEAAGTMWLEYEYGVLPLYNPVTQKPLGILDWYEYWLNKNIAAFESGADVSICFNSYTECVIEEGLDNANNKALKEFTAENFAKQNNSAGFIAVNNIWGAKINVYVQLDGNGNVDTIRQYLQKINDLCKWVELNQKQIVEALVKSDCFNELEETIKDTCETSNNKTYITEAEDKITLPISKAKFKKSVSVSSLAIYFVDGDGTDFLDFKASYEKPHVALDLSAEPFTCGNNLCVDINYKKQIGFGGIVG